MGVLLVTGFEPFGGDRVNPAWEAVCRLPDRIGTWEIRRLQIPVIYGEAVRKTLEAARTVQAGAILSVGLAAGRAEITPEMVAINLRYAGIPDNAGQKMQDVPCDRAGENAYFSTLPVRKMTEAIQKAGIAARVSYSAGTFVCNDLMYGLLRACSGLKVKAGFIHVPLMKENATEGLPSMPLKDIITALTAAISAID